MATTSAISSATLGFKNILALVENLTYDDLPGTPTLSIDWAKALTGLTNFNVDMKTAAATPSATDPMEVACTKVWGESITASGTTDTLDLTALPSADLPAALDLTGLKVQGFILACPYSNTEDVALVVGAVNGYNLMNDASSKIVCPRGGIITIFFPESTTATAQGMPDVGASAKTLDLSSTMSNFVYSAIVIAG